MGSFWKIIYESIIQAGQQLWGNRLRTFLSLLGITIGIFCIIGVLSAVDSLEDNIQGSLAKLGDDVVYIQKFSWASDPNQNWWRYVKRPNVNYEDYESIKKRSDFAEIVGYWTGIGQRTVKYRSNSVEGSYLFTQTYEVAELLSTEIERGRYFTPSEYALGANKCIIGAEVAENLFGSIDPLGKEIKVAGHKLEVIGVVKKSGDDILQVSNFDPVVMVGFELGRKMANLNRKAGSFDSTIGVKPKAGIPVEELKGEVTGILRANRRISPLEEDNFSLNQLSILSNVLSSFFNVLNLLGLVIGAFAIFVGMFSVANIMFVSVKERTRIIGVKKAIGAKRWVILAEFLIESVILCILGGIVGLLLILVILSILTQAIDFDLHLSWSNVVFGLSLSAIIGVIAGMIPATQASGMDPVEAMRK